MSALKEAFAAKTSFLSGKGVPPEQITQAEQELGLSFSDEYREYLSDYGIGAYDGHELTGLTKSKRLNVITATTEARKRYTDLPADLYVIEELGVEELIILQNASGEIYACGPNYKLEKIRDSFTAYVKGKESE